MKGTVEFRANSADIAKLKSSKNSEILQIVLYGLVFFLSVVFRGEDSIRELAEDFHTKKDTIQTWINVISVVSMLLLILSAVLAGYFGGKLKRLEASCVILEEDKVSGTCFLPDRSEAIAFSIAYDRVDRASCVGNTDGINLIITANSGETYQCLSISDPNRAAALINEKCETLRRS